MFEPIQEPVIIFAIAVIIFLVTPFIMTKLKMPGIVGPIVAGIIIGPYGLNILARDSTIELLGTVGLLFIIFIAGLELDIDGFKKYKNRSLLFGLLSFNIPLLIGSLLGIVAGFSIPASLLLGSILGSHTLLAYPIASKIGVNKNKAVITTIGGTLVTDSFAMIFLAVISGMAIGEVNAQFWFELIISTAVYAAIILGAVPYLSKSFFKISGIDGANEFNYVLVVLFVSGWMALYAGLQPIIGAFLAGLSLNRYIFQHGSLMNRINFTANALFIPFFLLSVGMLMDLSVLFTSIEAWLLTIGIVLSLLAGKYLASWITAKVYHYHANERYLMFGLSTPQAAATLAATLVGFDLGLLNQATVNAIIIMILVSCVIGPYLTEKFARKLARSSAKPIEDTTEKKPERILIPVANPDTMEALMDLGFLVRIASKSTEPIYPLKVIDKDAKVAESDVATAEKMLGHAIFYAAGAEIPVRPLTRVDHSIGWGIERAVTEERITTIITGWNGAKTNTEKVFGGIIDNVLDHTYIRSMIVKQVQPIQTTERMIVVLPKGITAKPGFKDALQIVKHIVKQLSCKLMFIIMDDDFEAMESYIRQIKPHHSASFSHFPDWEMLERYCLKLGRDDLVVAISARKGTVAWHPSLEALPQKLSEKVTQNFIIFYPYENKEIDVRGARGTSLPHIHTEWPS
ncbi:cation:proton antiporter [Amphibacillus cookii]|uniref:cation:proton antiporter domain-containing protein n=1 Tax=Amphibacillus cookii TaxID=767787 RepID=UPI0019592A2F|nr:cation:proton antiporter [Amphibacillus cookii]MBM7540266.1 Kef-type K+ transport system membrane component KefB [Amphibacillus cookii]